MLSTFPPYVAPLTLSLSGSSCSHAISVSTLTLLTSAGRKATPLAFILVFRTAFAKFSRLFLCLSHPSSHYATNRKLAAPPPPSYRITVCSCFALNARSARFQVQVASSLQPLRRLPSQFSLTGFSYFSHPLNASLPTAYLPPRQVHCRLSPHFECPSSSPPLLLHRVTAIFCALQRFARSIRTVICPPGTRLGVLPLLHYSRASARGGLHITVRVITTLAPDATLAFILLPGLYPSPMLSYAFPYSPRPIFSTTAVFGFCASLFRSYQRFSKPCFV